MADVPLLKAPMALTDLAGADVAAEGQVPTADGLGGVAWEAPAAGGAGSGLLALTHYNPAVVVDKAPESSTLVDMDAANLVITFVAPASGRVLIALAARTSVVNTALEWNLREGTSDVPDTRATVAYLSGTAQNAGRTTHRAVVSGLTPGASYTYKWGHARAAGTSASTRYGGGEGSAVMEVWSA